MTEHEQGWRIPVSWWIEDAEQQPDPLVELAVTLGAEVRELREGMGWSRSILTRRSGTSRAWLTRLEDGNGVPSVAVLTRLAEALGKRLRITLVDEREALSTRHPDRKEVKDGEQRA
jgi:transcriptional regulator with XRE-family HTH domain